MLVVVGGHSRNIGKTSVMEGLIHEIPEVRWTAVKITQHGHGICSISGTPCDCAVEYDHPYALSEETRPADSDSGRYLAAGAVRSYWLRTAVGQLQHGMPALRQILAGSQNAILESNSVLEFLQPDLYVVVVDWGVRDWKESTRRYIERADALVVVGSGLAPQDLAGKSRFEVAPPDYISPQLVEFVRLRMRKEAQR